MNSIDNLLPLLKKDYSCFSFVSGKDFYWSPSSNTIYYSTHHKTAEYGVWALFHELAHALLGHQKYDNDFELLQLESKTWYKASKIASKYGIAISKDHIQDCLDTYRDWLHTRSKCPICKVVSLQRDDGFYQCFNCKSVWEVPQSPQSTVVQKIINKK
ncbi:ImmA/IrrE family metallo-endopeptidase [Candidatus Saccharibacteria bacterium]|jgi:ribosomal protein L37AE/L43A|nr:ImmA/IrrE family metallo-endopeptidase [Candidatus Saccharibacteria bacterium]